jgi:hypothetical protein
MTKEHGNLKPFDWHQFDTYCSVKFTKRTCAELMGISEDTIEKRVRKEYDMTFTEYRETKLAPTKIKLVQKAIDMALGGNVTMLIFTLKNLCGWTDKVEQTVGAPDGAKKFTLNYKIVQDK